MRRCFIHIGTHKTGTTAIQHLLSRSVPALRRKGYVYPQSGRLAELPGHHNIAWQISGDRRFEPRVGTIEDLLAEVKFESGSIILSSEDFEGAAYHREFREFINMLQDRGFETTLILYVRPQTSYLARIYLTLIPLGLAQPFVEVLRSALDNGEFLWREWAFSFDYCNLLQKAGSIPNVGVIARAYDETQFSVCADFLSLFDLRLSDVNIEHEVAVNASSPLIEYLTIFVSNRIGRPVSPTEGNFVRALVPPGANVIKLSPGVALQIERKFYTSNRELAVRYNLELPLSGVGIDANDQGSDGVYVDRLFSADIDAYFK